MKGNGSRIYVVLFLVDSADDDDNNVFRLSAPMRTSLAFVNYDPIDVEVCCTKTLFDRRVANRQSPCELGEPQFRSTFKDKSMKNSKSTKKTPLMPPTSSKSSASAPLSPSMIVARTSSTTDNTRQATATIDDDDTYVKQPKTEHGDIIPRPTDVKHNTPMSTDDNGNWKSSRPNNENHSPSPNGGGGARDGRRRRRREDLISDDLIELRKHIESEDDVRRIDFNRKDAIGNANFDDDDRHRIEEDTFDRDEGDENVATDKEEEEFVEEYLVATKNPARYWVIKRSVESWSSGTIVINETSGLYRLVIVSCDNDAVFELNDVEIRFQNPYGFLGASQVRKRDVHNRNLLIISEISSRSCLYMYFSLRRISFC